LYYFADGKVGRRTSNFCSFLSWVLLILGSSLPLFFLPSWQFRGYMTPRIAFKHELRRKPKKEGPNKFWHYLPFPLCFVLPFARQNQRVAILLHAHLRVLLALAFLAILAAIQRLHDSHNHIQTWVEKETQERGPK
jgi:hypothetical protein